MTLDTPAYPVQVGDELMVTISEYGQRGDGVARVDGLVIFVPGAKKDEQINVQITKTAARYAMARRL